MNTRNRVAKNIFTLLVDNEFGVLTRVTALIRRAGWNIRSLSVAETAVPEVSRLTICLECRHNTLDSVLERLGKLGCVRKVTLYEPEGQVARELCVLRLAASDPGVDGLCDRWGLQVVAREGDDLLLSAALEPSKMDELIREARSCGLLDVARSGAIAMERRPDGTSGKNGGKSA